MSLSSLSEHFANNQVLDAIFSKADPILSLAHRISTLHRDGKPQSFRGFSMAEKRTLSGLRSLGFIPEATSFPDYAFEMGIELGTSVVIAVVGCGGTGSHLVPTLLQYIASAKLTSTAENPFPSVKVILIDGDSVEQKNLIRQRFAPHELGMNKAEALASRYGSVYDIPIFHVPHYLTFDNVMDVLDTASGQEQYAHYHTPREMTSNATSCIVIGAVDNHTARSVIYHHFTQAVNYKRNIFWIDAGNEDTYGQVVLGARPATEGRQSFYSGSFIEEHSHWSESTLGEEVLPFDLPCFFDRFPEQFFKVGVKDPNAQNCVELSQLDPQTIQANMMSAYCVNAFLTQIFSQKITSSFLKFNTLTGSTTPRLLTKSNLIEDQAIMHDSRSQIFGFLYSLFLAGDNPRKEKITNFNLWLDNYFSHFRSDTIFSEDDKDPFGGYEPHVTA